MDLLLDVAFFRKGRIPVSLFVYGRFSKNKRMCCFGWDEILDEFCIGGGVENIPDIFQLSLCYSPNSYWLLNEMLYNT
ncbi:hypothetical protein CCY01nite_14170 [Chitinophaga cymbidii]|uniref:Uncharacterized protein n=1 Tax=Chitinophaga cymbidii TaxID=1096750 RepID=A0A512RHI8_9BACT|nr:hypothetical protein CCY01nite_14170 [Chitinophaga cymbidii]